MPESKRPLKVFLCHAHSDKDAVKALYDRLVKDGVDAWLDKENLLPGQDWELEIRKAVREADVVVVCLSKQFNQAGFRQKEVRLALDTAMEQPEGEIFIIPARLEECDNLESLRKWHWVDLFENNGYEILIRALKARADKVGTTIRVKKISLNKESSLGTKNEAHINRHKQKIDRQKFFPSSRNKVETFVSKNASYISYALVVLVLLSCALIIYISKVYSPLVTPPLSTPPPTTQAVFTSTVAPLFATKSVPNSTPLIQKTGTPASLPPEITDAKGISMLLVPAGYFVMGSNSGKGNEMQPYDVYLDSFYIDKYEVTNNLYAEFLNSIEFELSVESSGNQTVTYQGNVIYALQCVACPLNWVDRMSWNGSKFSVVPKYQNHPANMVTWFGAEAYCKWREERLPTEMEWEKAARGTDGRTYPWGESIDNTFANYDDYIGDTTSVGSYDRGKSVYGLFDMAGNVWEWTVDSVACWEPDCHVMRGGSWNSPFDNVYSAISVSLPSYFTIFNYGDLGFRCARSVP